MDEYKSNASLHKMNTLGVESIAQYIYPLWHEAGIYKIYDFSLKKNLPIIPLGSGSNIVFGPHVDAIVMPVKLTRKVINIKGDDVFITLGAGLDWHETVRWSLGEGYYGLENLSMIPGTVGAAPVQNIGAYGVEIKDRLVQVKGFYYPDKKYVTLSRDDCEFGYRESIFKGALKNRFVITEIMLKLSRTLSPVLTYPELEKTICEYCGKDPVTGMRISDVICKIRKKKLPDTSSLGSVGSFFKNPVIHKNKLKKLHEYHKNAVVYPLGNERYKVAAGWLIDACGLKGYRQGEVGVYEKQALVLVNHGKADGVQIMDFAEKIRRKVLNIFNIHLEIEPFVYPPLSANGHKGWGDSV